MRLMNYDKNKKRQSRGVGALAYRAMLSQVKKLENKIGISSKQREEALGRLIDDIVFGNNDDLPIAIQLCEKYEVAPKVTETIKK